MKTIQITITGHVQGVGMRYFIYRNANLFNIKGYVKNKRNGTVFALFQATQTEIDSFLSFIKKKSPGHIENISIETIKTEKIYKNFKINLF